MMAEWGNLVFYLTYMSTIQDFGQSKYLVCSILIIFDKCKKTNIEHMVGIEGKVSMKMMLVGWRPSTHSPLRCTHLCDE